MVAFGITDVGVVRESNQDMYHIEQLSENTWLAIVCDGMGGTNGGNIASEMATNIISEKVKQSYKSEMDVNSIRNILISAVTSANSEIHLRSLEEKEYFGMGTTVVAAIVSENLAQIVHVGDSRAYLSANNTFTQLTADHSFVQELVSRGEISESDANLHPQKNLITRAVGVGRTIDIDYDEIDVEQGNVILICSDGLTNMCSDAEIANVLSQNIPNVELSCKKLVALANEYGGTDNITTVLVQI